MLEDGIYIKSALNLVYVEVISNINVSFPQVQHSFKKNKCQGILSTFMLAYLINLYSFGAWCINGWYSGQDMSNFPILYSTTTLSKFIIFMLALLGLYFSR